MSGRQAQGSSPCTGCGTTLWDCDGCESDLATVDSYGVSRGAARRVARRHL